MNLIDTKDGRDLARLVSALYQKVLDIAIVLI